MRNAISNFCAKIPLFPEHVTIFIHIMFKLPLHLQSVGFTVTVYLKYFHYHGSYAAVKQKRKEEREMPKRVRIFDKQSKCVW